jgi:ribosomal protein L11 methylase PrmA
VLDLRAAAVGTYDLVVANLTGGLLVQAAGHLRRLAAPHGRLVLSGLLKNEEAEVRAAFAGCAVAHRAEEDEWLCLTLAA